MSIVYFPKIYPDELVSSVLARYYAQSGFLSYKDAYANLFVKSSSNIDREFIKDLKTEALDMLIKEITLDELIEKHTMYPYYGRFIDDERRNKAYEAIRKMQGDYVKLLGCTYNKSGIGKVRHLRYCPLCAKDDREEYGETYWHRVPQIKGNNVCPTHGCFYSDSEIIMDSRGKTRKTSTMTAEDCVPLEERVTYCHNEVEVELAKYMADVFLGVVYNNAEPVRDFLKYKMLGTPYISVRGEHCYFTKLWNDMRLYYKGISEIDNVTREKIQRIMNNNRFEFNEICMIALLLGIKAEELITREMTLMQPEEQFDDKVQKMLNKGMSIRATARALGVSLSIVRMSIEIYGKDTQENKDKIVEYRNRSRMDWDKLDNGNFPKVRKAVEELHGYGERRPVKVSYYSVSRKLGISGHQLMKMKKCSQIIEDNRDTIEKHNARKIIWALKELDREEKPFVLWRVCAITKLEKEHIISTIPCLKEMNPDVAELVEQLI